MTEDVAQHFAFPNFTTPTPGTLREVLDNYMAPRDKISLNRLGMTKVKSGGLSMMLKTGMVVDQDYTFFKYGPPHPHKDLKSQVRTTVSQPGMKLPQKKFSQGTSKRKLGRNPHQMRWSWIIIWHQEIKFPSIG